MTRIKLNKKGAIVIIETFISIFLILSFFIAYMQYAQKDDFVYDSDYDIARNIFNSDDLRDCFDSLQFGCYQEMQGCLSEINNYYTGELILCIMQEDTLPELPKREISSFRLYKTIKESELSPYEIGVFFLK